MSREWFRAPSSVWGVAIVGAVAITAGCAPAQQGQCREPEHGPKQSVAGLDAGGAEALSCQRSAVLRTRGTRLLDEGKLLSGVRALRKADAECPSAQRETKLRLIRTLVQLEAYDVAATEAAFLRSLRDETPEEREVRWAAQRTTHVRTPRVDAEQLLKRGRALRDGHVESTKAEGQRLISRALLGLGGLEARLAIRVANPWNREAYAVFTDGRILFASGIIDATSGHATPLDGQYLSSDITRPPTELSPDEQRIVAFSAPQDSPSSTVSVLDARTGRQRLSVPVNRDTLVRLFVGSRWYVNLDGTEFQVLDLESNTGFRVASDRSLGEVANYHSFGHSELRMHGRGDTLAVTFTNGTGLWNLAKRRFLRLPRSTADDEPELKLLRDGKRAVLRVGGQIRLVDTETGNPLRTLTPPRVCPLTDFDVSPDEREVAVGGGGFVCIFDLRSGGLRRTLKAPLRYSFGVRGPAVHYDDTGEAIRVHGPMYEFGFLNPIAGGVARVPGEQYTRDLYCPSSRQLTARRTNKLLEGIDSPKYCWMGFDTYPNPPLPPATRNGRFFLGRRASCEESDPCSGVWDLNTGRPYWPAHAEGISMSTDGIQVLFSRGATATIPLAQLADPSATRGAGGSVQREVRHGKNGWTATLMPRSEPGAAEVRFTREWSGRSTTMTAHIYLGGFGAFVDAEGHVQTFGAQEWIPSMLSCTVGNHTVPLALCKPLVSASVAHDWWHGTQRLGDP